MGGYFTEPTPPTPFDFDGGVPTWKWVGRTNGSRFLGCEQSTRRIAAPDTLRSLEDMPERIEADRPQPGKRRPSKQRIVA